MLVVVLGVLFAHQTTADGLDRGIDASVISWLAGHQKMAGWLAFSGSPIRAAALSAAIAIACLLAAD